MRNLKRFLAMALTMLMVIGSFSMSAFAFSDVADDNKYAEAINALAEIGVAKGVGNDTFNPDGDINRWQAALLMAKLASGKGLEDNAYWYAEENTTSFIDVAPAHYLGSIAFASNYNFIVGFVDPDTGKDVYKPEANIKFQEALTMGVRALGYDYGTAGYPWKFISKAIALGLDENLSDVAYTDTLTRAEYFQFIYNLLYATNKDGTSFAQDNFQYLPAGGYVTVVITSNNSYSILNDVERTGKAGYVGFNLLNPNGTIDESITYFLPASAFGSDPQPKDSYSVYTEDNFQSLKDAIKCTKTTFSTVGDAKFSLAQNSGIVTIDGKAYAMVDQYSYLYNNQGNKGNNPEIIVEALTDVGTLNNTGDMYARDVYYNILNSKGEVALYYMPTLTGSYTMPYVMDLGAGKYETAATLADLVAKYNAVHTTAQITASLNGQMQNYQLILNGNAAINNYSNKGIPAYAYAYAELVCYDDNGDGVYDRAYFAPYTFNNGAALPTGDNQYFKGWTINGTNGGYFLYTYDILAKTVTIKAAEGITTVQGFVSQVYGDAITIDGQVYTKSNLYNYNNNNGVGNLYEYVGANIQLVLWNGQYIAINKGNNAPFIIMNEIVGLSANGYPIANVYNGSISLSQIQIATVNGVNWMTYYYNYRGAGFTTIYDLLVPKSGFVYTGYCDQAGYWHIIETNEGWTVIEPKFVTELGPDGDELIEEDLDIVFNAGIAHYENVTAENFTDSDVIFVADANTMFIVNRGIDSQGKGTFAVGQGIPVDGSEIHIDTIEKYGEYMNGVMMVKKNANGVASVVYVNSGAMMASFNQNQGGSTISDYDTIIYYPANGYLSGTSVEGIIGTTRDYNNMIDMLTGKFVNVKTLYNRTLEKGQFYKIRQGYVSEKVDVNGVDEYHVESGIGHGQVKKITNYFCSFDNYRVRDKGGHELPGDGTYTYSEWGKTVVIILNADGSVAVKDGQPATTNTVAAGTKAYFYNGKLASSRVILAGDGVADIAVN